MWKKLFISVVISIIAASQAYAKDLFRSEFETVKDASGVNLLKHVGKSNAHPGGGYVSFLGGEIVGTYYTPGDGCGDMTVQDVNIDGSTEAQGGPAGAQSTALKTHYRTQDNCGQSFQKNTTIITFPPQKNLYVRLYQKWSPNWIWPLVQQKFAKIESQDKNSTQNFFFKKSGNMLVNYSRLGKSTSSLFPSEDDLPSVDGVDDLSLGEWHEIQMHVKMSDPGQSNGVLEYWINGIKRFGVYNIENNNGNTVGLDHIELQHVYETFDASGNKTGPTRDMPTWMKNIVISDTFIPGDCPLCPKPPSAVEKNITPSN